MAVHRSRNASSSVDESSALASTSTEVLSWRSSLALSCSVFHYAAFDALWVEGKDLRPLLLTGEVAAALRERLERIARGTAGPRP
jgi:hypothetical protein